MLLSAIHDKIDCERCFYLAS